MKRASLLAVLGVVACPVVGYSYVLGPITYRQLYERSDLVVIAKPLKTIESNAEPDLGANEKLRADINVVETDFEVLLVLKGTHKHKELTFINLQTKSGKPSSMFGGLGTFFFDFHAKRFGKSSYLLFLKSDGKGRYLPAWHIMEWCRATKRLPAEGAF